MGKLSYNLDKSTGSVVSIQWSELGDPVRRKQVWGGSINSWEAKKVGEFVYLIPRNVKISIIDKALKNALLPSDRAVVTYPHGSNKEGSSAMQIRLYGKAAADAKK